MSLPVKVRVWRRDPAGGWRLVTVLSTWETFSIEPRHNQPGPWSMTVPVGAQAFQLEKTDLVTFDLRGGSRFTGTIEEFGAATDETSRPVLEVTGLDALSWLGDALGWPTPAATLYQQTEVTWSRTGPAETVIRALVKENLVERLGYDLALEPDLGRGTVVTLNSSFDNVLTLATSTARLGDIGVRLGLVETTSNARAALTLQFYTPADRSNRVRLSHRLGTLRRWSQTERIPSATYAIVQAAKEAAGRTVAAVNVGSNIVTLTEPHGLRTGDTIVFTDGTPPAPLLADVAYAAIRASNTSVKVALTRLDASQGDAIDLTTAGSGTITLTQTTRAYYPVPSSSDWGRTREVLVTGVDQGAAALTEESPGFTTLRQALHFGALAEAGQQALRDGAAQQGFELEVAEAEGMRYGTHYALGDDVTVELATGLATVTYLGAVRVKGDADGVVFQAIPGDPDANTPMFALAKTIRALRAQASKARED